MKRIIVNFLALADVLTLPTSLNTVEEEVFYKTTSVDEVILPEGIYKKGSIGRRSLP